MRYRMVNFAVGVLAGAALFGGSAAYAAGVMAERSTNTVYVDAQRTELEAYTINGENYVRLRDIGKAVNINVYWDGAVQIDTNAPYTGEAPAQPVTEAADAGVVTLPTDGSKYVPKVGDKIPCDDGTLYEVTDVERFENNVFAPNFNPTLPTPTCDWSLFPTLELPAVDVKHYVDETGDRLFVRNLYETRRMVYTIYNALGTEPAGWRDGKPLAKIFTSIKPEDEPFAGYFWPWRSSEVEKHVHHLPNTRFSVEAWDYYLNGTYQYCRYYILTI